MSLHSLPITASHIPPKSFHPHTATDKEIKAYFYPPRPDPTKAPIEYAEWESIAVRDPQYIPSNLVERSSGGLEENKHQAGAVLRATSTGIPAFAQSIQLVHGVWKVPIISPTKDASGHFNKDEHRIWNWIGMDGWKNNHCPKIGTESTLKVESDGKITEIHSVVLLFCGTDNRKIRKFFLKDFPISAGDGIIGQVWSDVGSTGPYYAAVFKETDSFPRWTTRRLESDLGIKR